MLTLFEMISRGGVLMVPIIFCSVLSLAIIIERVISLNRAQIDSKEFIGSIDDVLRRNKILEAINICDKTIYAADKVVISNIGGNRNHQPSHGSN
ncbi:hypothetical protein ES707_20174 [subsurface metagenome]